MPKKKSSRFPVQTKTKCAMKACVPTVLHQTRRRGADVYWTLNKKPKVLQCCYNAAPSAPAHGEVSPVEDIKKACSDQGFVFSKDLVLNLRPSTREALASCPDIKALSELPLKWQQVIRGEKLNVTLCKEHDRDAFTVRSGAKGFKAGEPVLLMVGKYTEAEKWDRKIGDPSSHAHLWAYDIPADILQPGYKGPDLVLHCFDQGNESRFLQDFSWFGGTNNLQTEVQWAKLEIPESGIVSVPLVVFTAIERIPPRTELGFDWGELLWLVLSQQEVMAQVPQSMQAYRKFLELSKLCEKHKVTPQKKADVASTSNASTPNDVVQYFDAKKKRYIIEKQPAEKRAPRGEAQEVKKRKRWERNCEKAGPAPEEAFRVIQSEQELRREFPQIDFIKETDFETNIPQRILNAMNKNRDLAAYGGHPRLSWEEKAILDTGTLPQCRVAEITSIVHPVRYCTLPCHKAYTVVAAGRIAAGTLLGEYVGVAHFPKTFNEQFESGDSSPEEQAYAFDIDLETLESMFPLRLFTGSVWQPLVVENLRAGNIARFINCCWGMEGATKNVNTVARIRWNQFLSRPAILLYALTDIEDMDEIVIDYGDAYWRRMARWVQEAHFAFYKKTADAAAMLEAALRSAGVSLEDIQKCGDLEPFSNYSPSSADYDLWSKACAESRKSVPSV